MKQLFLKEKKYYIVFCAFLSIINIFLPIIFSIPLSVICIIICYGFCVKKNNFHLSIMRLLPFSIGLIVSCIVSISLLSVLHYGTEMMNLEGIEIFFYVYLFYFGILVIISLLHQVCNILKYKFSVKNDIQVKISYVYDDFADKNLIVKMEVAPET